MGARGPAPTPIDILKARGSWRAKLNPHEPKGKAGAPTCPKGFTAAQKAVWQSVVKSLKALNVLMKEDGPQLERYCRMFVRWREAENFIDKNGMTYTLKHDDPGAYMAKIPNATPAGMALVAVVEYPQVKIAERLDKALRAIEANFGLTPSARSRIQTLGETARTPDAQDEEATPFFDPTVN